MTRARFWNVWWTLTVISAALTLGVALLEALGVFHDLGVVLSIVGLLATMVFGLTASTRSSLGEFRSEVVPLLEGMDARLGRVETYFGGADARLGGVEARFDGVGARLDRIIALLDERLPRPAA
jgi:hypothetical protein